MQLRKRSWWLAGIILLLVVGVFWRVGRREERPRSSGGGTVPPSSAHAPAVSAAVTNPITLTSVPANVTSLASNDPLRLRLSNTTLNEEQLSEREQALLLMNALVDTARPVGLPIPEHLRAKGDPGSYIVQSRGLLTDAFRVALKKAGAEIVSYVPNNAYLVRASAEAVAQLRADPLTQTVLAWEPYFKLEDELLALAVEQKPLPETRHLNLLVYPAERAAVEASLAAMRAVITETDRSPFGVVMVVRPPLDALVDLAQLPGVQRIELNRRAQTVNDQARVRLRVNTNGLASAPNFRGMTGKGVLVNVNDTGVEGTHAVFSPGRVRGVATDDEGHGTHVAGTIAGNGANSPVGVPGSHSNATFRGVAYEADIFSYPFQSRDSDMQENAAATNAFISNNSWGYVNGGGYTLSAASWDAAVRDALPRVEGPQPLLAVFAAGNSGGGPCGGLDDAIDAPATSKNVITVGAIENLRFITNFVTVIEYTLSNRFQPWLSMTDSNEVASFSRVGNIGARREGKSGRFKPDVVAPGTFVVSARASKWQQPTNLYCYDVRNFPLVDLAPDEFQVFSFPVRLHGVQIDVLCSRNQFTGTNPLPSLPIYVQEGSAPAVPGTSVGDRQATVGPPLAPVPPGTWYVAVENKGSNVARFDVTVTITITNNLGTEPEELFNLNAKLGPSYRYESGTSMAAPAVSGALALMHQYFTGLGATNSPALMKALLISGARSVSEAYNFDVAAENNRQGWGLVNITNSVPGTVTTAPIYSATEKTFTSPTMMCFDQSPIRALATGQSFTRTVNVAGNARTSPLRFSLVWTDPPGNPSVGVKLVNDLDLIVTNLVTGQVFIGNAFGPGNTFTPAASTNTTNGLALDRVNNVENVYIDASLDAALRLSAQYSVTVAARRVNVNAVTGHPDNAVQDFALVISHGNPRNFTTGSAITVGTEPIVDNPLPEVTVVTNGVPILNQRAGANSLLTVPAGLEITNGVPAQWHFFVVTNRLPSSDLQSTNNPIGAATNIAFATFLPPNLSQARTNRSDIDLYVSTDPNLTNLVPGIIAASRRSLKRGGTESVVLGLGELVPGGGLSLVGGEIFYAGVKCEDQQAANFGFFAISSSSPFSSEDTNGNVYLEGYPFNVEIPDGSAEAPQGGFMFAFNTREIVIQNVVVTNYITHTNGGDLFGALDLDGGKVSVLNANRYFSSLDNLGNLIPYRFIYDDSDSGEIPESTRTDTPGTLRNFVGEDATASSWRLTMVDSAPSDTGQVNRLQIKLEPRKEDLTNGVGIVETILPGRFFYTVVDVAATVTNLQVCATPDAGIVEVYIRRGAFPDRDTYDIFGVVAPPGDCVNLGLRDSPPLSRGRYFIGIYNPNALAVTVGIKVNLQHDLRKGMPLRFRGGNGEPIVDDALTTSTQFVGYRGIIADAEVGVRIAHERVSDLVLRLVSPEGTRLLLTENRGRSTADYGFGSLLTNIVPVQSSGSNAPVTNIIVTTQTEGTLQIDYNFYTLADRITVYYEGVKLLDTGFISGSGSLSVDYGPGTSTNIVIVANEGGNPQPNTVWDFVAVIYNSYTYSTFTESTERARLPIKFEPPPFTNFNYFQTNYVTNVTLVADGFEDLRRDSRIIAAPRFFNGWQVTTGSVEVVTNAIVLAGAQSNWFLPAIEGSRLLDLNGATPGAIATNLNTIPGASYRVSYAYAKNPGDAGPVTAEIWWKGTNASGREVVTATASGWSRGQFSFSAIDAVTTLELISTSVSGPTLNSAGVLFDDIRVEDIRTNVVAGIYYHPEEPLTPFFGQNAFGNWTLEILDNRAGGGVTNALLGWRLNLTFVNTNPPVTRLSNNVEACVTLLADETAYFYTDVPIAASSVTNFINVSDQVDVFYNQSGLPVLNEPPDTAFFYNVLSGETVLSIDGWNSFETGGIFAGAGFTPTIAPGKRYYLALHNRGTGTNYACVRVAFDELTPNLVGIVPITNQCFNYTGSATNAGAIDYYSFDVSPDAIGVRFSLTNILVAGAGDLNLVVRRGLPLPNDTRFTGRSANPTPAEGEFIEVADFFQTRLAGRWYIGVIHTSGDAVTYDVCAEEVGGPITEIFDHAPLRATNAPAASLGDVTYYRIYVPPPGFLTNGVLQRGIALADFQLTNITAAGDMDLYLSSTTMQPLYAPPSDWLARSTNFSASLLPQDNFESNRVSAFSVTNPLTPGWWFIAAVNKSPVPVGYDVQVDLYSTNLPYLSLTNGVAFCDNVVDANDLALYQFDVSPDALQVAFEVFNQSGADVDFFAHPLFPVPPAGFFPFIDSVSTNSYPTNEFIGGVVGAFQTNRFGFAPFFYTGPWYLTVKTKLGFTAPVYPINFCVRATEITERDVQPLTNGLAVCNTVPVADTNALYSGVQFFSFDVPVGIPLQATFETFAANGNVDLYVQRNLPFTNFTTYTSGGGARPYPYFSEQPGSTDEYLCLGTNSTPTALAPGRWHIAVVNRDTVPVSYCLRASVIGSQNLVRIGNGELFCRSGLAVTNGGPIAGQDYYVFRVASNAVQATFETVAMSGNVDLFLTTNLCLTNFSTYDASLAPYPYFSTNLGTVADAICLRTNTTPVRLGPGDWYLTVVNREPATPVSYCVRATQLYDTNFIVVATNGAICRTVAVNDGSAARGIEYFIINVSNSPALMNFQTFNATGNVDLYVTRDPCLPNFAAFDAGTTNYPYSSTLPGRSAECLSVTDTSVPQVLTNGTWYVAVVNRSPVPVDYCFLATPFASDPGVPLVNNTALCGQTVNFSASPIGVNYYVFDVPANALQVTYEVYGASGPVDLYVNGGFCFENRDSFSLATTNAAYASTNLGNADETIVVSGASSPLPLTPGRWYLAVVNRDPAVAVTFCVKASALLTTDVIGVTNGIGYTTPFVVPAGGVRWYHYRVSPNAIQATFEVLGPSGDVDLYVESGFAPANIYSSSYASVTPGLAEERIVVDTNSAPTPLVAGEWFLAVTNSAAFPVTYTVRVSEILDTGLIRLFNGISFSNTVAGLGSLTGVPADYYVFTVSNAAVRAQFEVISPDGDVTLVARLGLPLPDLYTATVWSTNTGNSSELIVLFTNSTPVALAPGDWYICVLNNTNVPVNYTVAAYQYFSAGTNVGIGRITITSNLFCASYTGVLPGVNYFVEGTADFFTWVPVTPTIKATGTTLNWCIALPNPYNFFRLREGLSPLSAGPMVTVTSASAGPLSASFQWNAPAGQRFVIEFTDTLAPSNWRPVPGYSTSVNGTVTFNDDGSRTGGMSGTRYYRIIRVP